MVRLSTVFLRELKGILGSISPIPLLLLLLLSGSILSLNEQADEYIVLACQGKNGAWGVVVARLVILAREISKSSPPASQSNG